MFIRRSLRVLAAVLGLVATTQAQGLLFVNKIPENGITYDINQAAFCSAIAAGDYNGDGWLDVLIGGGTPGARLYRNNQDRTFTDVTRVALPSSMPNFAMAQFADLDNDGDEDVVLVRWYGDYYLDTGFDFLINKGGHFQLKSESQALGLARDFSFSGGLALSDVDQDGYLDAVRMCYTGRGYCMRRDSRMRLNETTSFNGYMRFVDRSNHFDGGIMESRRHWAAVMADFDNDGLQDLHAAVDVGHDYQSRSLGNGQFIDVSVEANVSNIGQDMGLAIADIDGDGDNDIFSSNIEYHVLYVNDGSGTFSNQAGPRGVRQNATPSFDWGWGTQFADFDNDFDYDLAMIDTGPGMLCVNDGNGYFTRDDSDHGAFLHGRALLCFDYDRDGDMDILTAARTGNYPQLLENVSPANEGRHWLVIKLQGETVNRDGVGAKIYAHIGDRMLMHEVIAGESFISGPPLLTHFGMGESTTIDLLEVHWPDGDIQTFDDVEGDRYVKIAQADGMADY